MAPRLRCPILELKKTVLKTLNVYSEFQAPPNRATQDVSANGPTNPELPRRLLPLPLPLD